MIIRLNSTSQTISIKSTNHNITLRQVRSNISLRHTGIKGDPGEGVPTGGTAGQVLTKDSSTDFDTSWQDASGGIDSVVAGTNIDVDNTDPNNPIVSVENLTLSDITDVTATATEVNYTDGVTSNIQTQLDAKVAKAGDTMTGDLSVPDEAYGATWGGSLEVPTKNAIYDKIEAIPELTEGTGINLTDLGGGVTEISVDGASVDHGSLAGLSDDDHTQYALLAGRSGGQTLRGGTSKTNNLVLSANSQAYDNKSFGYIETTHPIVWNDDINIGATFTGFFSEGYHRFISQTGTFTLDPTMNAGEVVALKSAVTIKYSSSQIITASPTFMSQNTIQPTAAVNDNALSSWSSYIANDRFMPLLTTAITATTTNFVGLQSAPTVGIAAGSHASASGVATNLIAVETASKVTSQGTATNARGVLVHNPVKEGSGIVTNNIGVDIESMTSGSTLNVGLRIAPSTSAGAQAIQITGTPTTAAGGITFGSDVNLYRSAANVLKTDDDLEVADEAYSAGWNGSLEVPTKNAIYDKLETIPSASFETVSKNLKAWDYTLSYTGDSLTSITYTAGAETIVKTLGYTGDQLTTITLSGDTPSGIELVKTLTYTGDSLTGVAYA